MFLCKGSHIHVSSLHEVRREEKENRRKGEGNQAINPTITRAELYRAIKQLKTEKSPGLDKIINKMLQYLHMAVLNFNLSWTEGQVPQ